MLIAGDIDYRGQHFLISLSQTKSHKIYNLYSQYTVDDRYRRLSGAPTEDKIVTSNKDIVNANALDYMIGSLKITRRSTEFEYFRSADMLKELVDIIEGAKYSTFRTSDINVNTRKVEGVKLHSKFNAKSDDLEYIYEKDDDYYTKLAVITNNVRVYMDSTVKMPTRIEGMEYHKFLGGSTLSRVVASTESLDYETLSSLRNLDFAKDKDYDSVQTIPEFDAMMDEFEKDVIANAEKGEETVVGLDSETDGLNIYYLNNSNPRKSRICAIPFAWKKNHARVIFTDMQFFDNVPLDYVIKRLKPYVTNVKFHGGNCDAEILGEENKCQPECLYLSEQTRQENLKVIQSMYYHVKQDSPADEGEKILNIDLFKRAGKQLGTQHIPSSWKSIENNYDKVTRKYRRNYEYKESELRKWINLVGHNSPFDSRVFYDCNVKCYFDNDTMQMAFDLNPGFGKGSRKLKALTHRLLGYETPELSDILGKGSEDKYRYINDIRVAILYGCCDADFTREIYFYLRKLMSDSMFKRYKTQDIPLMNKLYIAEYYGLKMDEEKVKVLNDHTYQDLNKIHDFCKEYVGRAIFYKNRKRELDVQVQSGLLSPEEAFTLECTIDYSRSTPYEFDMGGNDIRKVFYEILEYPKLKSKNDKKKKGKSLSVDKFVLKKLIKKKLESSSNYMLEDLVSDVSKDNKGNPLTLIDASKFNECKYPLAFVLSIYGVLNKEYTSYYNPIVKDNMESRLFKSFSMTRIATRRISNPSQTMKKRTKEYVIPFSSNFNLGDWDLAQVEYRNMVSLSHHTPMIIKLRDSEKDFHTESAAMLHGVPPYTITPQVRSESKAVNFGIPYGLGEESLCETMYSVVTPLNRCKTKDILYKFDKNNKPVMNMLEEARAEALVPIDMSEEFRRFIDAYEKKEVNKKKVYELDEKGNKIPTPIGMVKNAMGFYRLFNLSDLDNSKRKSIERQAGNFPIQSFAAELFRILLIRFHNKCVEMDIDDMIVWHLLIHDEILFSYNKVLHPFLLYKVIKDSCMLTFPGHTSYFVGMCVGNNWYDCKSDVTEAPVIFLNRMAKRYENGEFSNECVSDAKTYVMEHLHEYYRTRIHEVLKDIVPDIDSKDKIIDMDEIIPKFTNYTVRAYTTDNFSPAFKVEDRKDLNLNFVSSFITWCQEFYGESRNILFRNTLYDSADVGSEEFFMDYTANDYTILDDSIFNEGIDFISEEGEDDDWGFNVNGFTTHSFDTDDDDYTGLDSSDYVYGFELDDSATTLEKAIKSPINYSNIVSTFSTYNIKCSTQREIPLLKKALEPFVRDIGKKVCFMVGSNITRWLTIDLDVEELSAIIENVQENVSHSSKNYKNVMLLGDTYKIKCNSKREVPKLKKCLEEYANDDGKTVIFDTYDGSERWIKVEIDVSDLDNIISKVRENITNRMHSFKK